MANRPDASQSSEAQAEAARFFAARGSRGSPEKALAILDQIGRPENLRDGDRVEAPTVEY